ncbi:MAG: MFS transporter [Verrucomicrobiaceae bacterium]|uniref:MFS transporter n=1 Tax=Aestuariivirga sp. TaxID=2650926 RepID=UPI0030162B04
MPISSNGSADPRAKASLWVLAFGNFLIGTGVLMPAAMLTDLSTSFNIDVGTTGHLLLVTGLVIGIGAPVLAALTSKLDRRLLLACVLLLNAAGHLASVFSQSFSELVATRTLIAIAAALFSPQAAAAVTLIVQPHKRDSAVAFVFVGWSAAMVVGVPVSGMIAQGLGWQTAFMIIAGLSLIGTLVLLAVLPRKLHTETITITAWRSALQNPIILALLLVTFFSLSGQFAIFTYLSPLLGALFSVRAIDIAVAFSVAGATGVIGNLLASRLASHYSTQKLIVLALSLMAAGAIFLSLSGGVFALGLFSIAIWGLGSFSSTSLQQSRLASTAPHLASATISLNTSTAYLGQAAGAAAAGLAFDTTNPAAVIWVALVPLAAAIAVSTAIGFTLKQQD